jgi:hypothetical protein
LFSGTRNSVVVLQNSQSHLHSKYGFFDGFSMQPHYI